MTQNDFEIMALTIYGEARGEYNLTGVLGLQAVANVIMNRFCGSQGETIAGICKKPYQFSCWNKQDPNADLLQSENLAQNKIFQICQNVVLQTDLHTVPDFTLGANHYHAKTITPYWANPSRMTLTLGNHVFYRLGTQG